MLWGGVHAAFFYTLLSPAPQPHPCTMKLVAAVGSPAQWVWAISELGLAGDAQNAQPHSALAGPGVQALATPHRDLFSL